MNILALRTLKVSTLALTILLTGCGEKTTQQDAADENFVSGQVLARVNGEEITIYELNNELSRMKISEDTREEMSKNVLKSLVVRTIFEQNAKKNKLDRAPNIMMDIERSKSTILAKAYLQSQMVKKPDVPRSEIEAFIFDNPNLFANRAYYTFDTIILSNNYLSKEKRERWESVTNLDDIESELLQEGLDYKRMPYTAFSETLPAGVMDDMHQLKLNGDVFFIVMKDVSYLNIYKTSRPAVLTGKKAVAAAEGRLSVQKTKEFLVKLEADAFTSANIEYFEDYQSLADKPKASSDIEAKKNLNKEAVIPLLEKDK